MSNETSTAAAEIRGLLLPLSDRFLLIPNILIAELVESVRHVQPLADAPNWLLGLISWRDLKLPLISFEAAEDSQHVSGKMAYVAIINALGGRDNCKFFAIALQGLPSALKVDEHVDRDLSVEPGSLELSAVKMGSIQARIPDFQGLEDKLAELGLI